MNVLVISLAVLGCFLAVTDGVTNKLWVSTNPRGRAIWRKGWNIDRTYYKGADSASTVRDPRNKKSTAIQIFISEGTVNLEGTKSGTGFYASPVPPMDCLTFRYGIWFENNFDFHYGGKLPGLYGGGAPCTAGAPGNSDCFTTRFIWRTGGVLGLSLFTADGAQETAFCDSSEVECNSDWGHKITTGFQIVTRTWYIITQTVRLNTPGQFDGYLSFNILGQRSVYSYAASNIKFRSDAATRIDGITFNAFFGGNMPCSASPKDQSILFRNFVLAAGGQCAP